MLVFLDRRLFSCLLLLRSLPFYVLYVLIYAVLLATIPRVIHSWFAPNRHGNYCLAFEILCSRFFWTPHCATLDRQSRSVTRDTVTNVTHPPRRHKSATRLLFDSLAAQYSFYHPLQFSGSHHTSTQRLLLKPQTSHSEPSKHPNPHSDQTKSSPWAGSHPNPKNQPRPRARTDKNAGMHGTRILRVWMARR